MRIRRVIIGYLIGGYVMAIVGCYLVASALSSAAGANTFTPLFTGLVLIVGAG